MLLSLLISLREGLEAALIIGIVLGTLEKTGHRDYSSSVWMGVLSAAGISLAIGIGLNLAGAGFSGKGENAFEGLSMVFAAVLLTWMVLWMGRQARSRQMDLEIGIRQAVSSASRRAVFSLAFLSVLREGAELVFFVFAAGLGIARISTGAGTVIGLLLAALGGWLIFSSTRKLNLRRFFQLTNLLLLLIAAGMVSRGMHEFIEAGWLAAGIPHLWNVGFLLSDQSFLGQLGGALFGYNSSPSLTEVVAYVGYLLLVWLLSRTALLPGTRRPAGVKSA